MSSNTTEALSRDTIMKLLSDTEVAKVSRAEETRLIEGDEYIDLTAPSAGVQQMHTDARTPPGHALPRSAVSDATWLKIVKLVAG